MVFPCHFGIDNLLILGVTFVMLYTNNQIFMMGLDSKLGFPAVEGYEIKRTVDIEPFIVT